MKLPFEGLFGDTCETRLLQFLLPMYGIEFDMADLVKEIGLTRQSIAKAMNKFAAKGMVKIRKEGRTPRYSINEDSHLVKRLEEFDNTLIASIIGEEEFRKIEEAYEKSVRERQKKGTGRTGISYSYPGVQNTGVTNRKTAYPVRKESPRQNNTLR